MKTLTLDIETTGIPAKGLNYKDHFDQFPYIVSMAFKINDEETQHFIINQEGRIIPEDVIKIHNITNEMCQVSAYKFIDVLQVLLEEASDSQQVVGHNIYFDTSIIKANVLRLSNESLYEKTEMLLHKDRRIDTMMKTIKFCNLKGKWPKLSELHMKLFNEEFLGHNAKEDVEATYKCFTKLRELEVL